MSFCVWCCGQRRKNMKLRATVILGLIDNFVNEILNLKNETLNQNKTNKTLQPVKGKILEA